MKQFQLIGPEQVIVGNGTASQIGDTAVKLGAHKVLLVTDKGVQAAGIAERCADAIRQAGLPVTVFDSTKPEPTIENFNDCFRLQQECGADLLVGVGGGSSMDLTKAVALVAGIGGKLQDYFGIEQVPARGLPTILLSSTSGTGSEVSKFAVLTDEATNLKKVIVSRHILAQVAIVDPELTLTVPPSVTAATGMDALSHAIEGYTAVASSPVTDALALEAIELIANNLRKVVADGRNLEARYNMSIASLLGGLVLNTTGGAGIVHALGFPIGVYYHLPHGLANSLVMPAAFDAICMGDVEKFAEVARGLGEPVDGLSLREAAGRVSRAVRDLNADIGLPPRLRDVGIKEDILPTMARDCFANKRNLMNTPRILTEETILKIYREAM